MVANKERMRDSVGWWYGGMVAREGYISSCVLVREEGVNGLLGIVYGDSGRKVVVDGWFTARKHFEA